MENKFVDKVRNRVCEHCKDSECEYNHKYIECEFSYALTMEIIKLYCDYEIIYSGFDDIFEEVNVDDISNTI